VKIVPDITYNVFGGTLNLAQSINPRVVEVNAPVTGLTTPYILAIGRRFASLLAGFTVIASGSLSHRHRYTSAR